MIQSEWITGQMDLTKPVAIREAVFGKEAATDAFDGFGFNAVMYNDEVPVGTGRIYHDGKQFRINYICVLEEYRGQRIGDLMTRLLLYKASQFAPEIFIEAPDGVEGFFIRYGFAPTGVEKEVNGVLYREYSVKKEDIYFPSKCGGCG